MAFKYPVTVRIMGKGGVAKALAFTQDCVVKMVYLQGKDLDQSPALFVLFKRTKCAIQRAQQPSG